MYLLIIALVLQIVSLILSGYIARLQNNGRKGNQSEEDFNKQVKRLNLASNIIQTVVVLCLLLNLLLAKGII